MKKLILLITIVLANFAIAGIEQAPPSFQVGHKKAVWTDFKVAKYEIVYDTFNQKAYTKAIITLSTAEAGHLVYDSITEPSEIFLDGDKTTQKLVSVPGNVSQVRMLQKQVAAGTHQLIISTPLRKGLKFKKNGNWSNVSSAFFIRDLKDRMFLEKYLPTNYEYDQYKMIMDVKVTGTKRWHSLFVNGKKEKLTNNHYRVTFPNYYSSSSVFFHLVPITKFVRWYLKYPSIDGRKIPVTIYSTFRFYNSYAKKKAWKVMRELEKDYGPWPHDQLIIYGTGIRGGMEYAGATETSIVSLGHELQHSYFAKGIHPANGNSGWLDEAIASWRDKGHQSNELPNYSSYNLAKHNVYTRKTDKKSYEKGRSFMSYLDYKLKKNGKVGLQDFLRKYFSKRKFTTVTTEIFRADLESYAGISFKSDFFQYIYGGNEKSTKSHQHNTETSSENPHHPELTEQELESII